MTSATSFAVVYCPPTLAPGTIAPVLCRVATADEASTFIGSLSTTDEFGVSQGHYGIDGPSPEPVATPTCPATSHHRNGGEHVEHTVVGCGSTNVSWDGQEMFDCLDCGIFFTPAEALAPADTTPANV